MSLLSQMLWFLRVSCTGSEWLRLPPRQAIR